MRRTLGGKILTNRFLVGANDDVDLPFWQRSHLDIIKSRKIGVIQILWNRGLRARGVGRELHVRRSLAVTKRRSRTNACCNEHIQVNYR
jgi:hypothetical protein